MIDLGTVGAAGCEAGREAQRRGGAERTLLVKGFFKDSLPALSEGLKSQLAPATIVDVDCDIYEGTVEALRYLLCHRLVVVR